MSKCKVIAVANQTGDVGKTTTTANVAIGLARNGQEVLILAYLCHLSRDIDKCYTIGDFSKLIYTNRY